MNVQRKIAIDAGNRITVNVQKNAAWDQHVLLSQLLLSNPPGPSTPVIDRWYQEPERTGEIIRLGPFTVPVVLSLATKFRETGNLHPYTFTDRDTRSLSNPSAFEWQFNDVGRDRDFDDLRVTISWTHA